ncbi:MAG: 4Fe-4S binding protein [Candidatus Nanopelagicales bacterium]|nr:4Fe-4S binding protein [Candidatus Nanopelagicales bacterium]
MAVSESGVRGDTGSGPSTVTVVQEPLGPDVLQWRPMRAVVRSRWYPGVIQWLVLAGFVLVGYQLIAGPAAAHDNLGTALMWILWWPIIPITFVLFGRLWCAVCPFATIHDWVQRLVGLERSAPAFLKKYGIWIIDAIFIIITWADHVFGIVESPWGSGVLLLLLTTSVVVSAAFLQRRAFCRYLCFLGGLSANYSQAGMVTLRAKTDVCRTCKARAACFNGTDTVPPCPLSSFPRTMDSSADCNLCARCVKSCPNDAITITVRPPTRELWFIRNPRIEVSFLAMAIMGIVLVQNLAMLEVWNDFLAWIGSVVGTTNYVAVFTIAFAMVVALPVGLLVVTSLAASSRGTDSIWKNFARFGYALIPLDIAAHMAHNLFHLLAEGKAVVFTALPLLGQAVPDESAALAGPGLIQILQFALLALGAGASAWCAFRLAKIRYDRPVTRRRVLAPYLVLISVLALVNVVLFLQPMTHRM